MDMIYAIGVPAILIMIIIAYFLYSIKSKSDTFELETKLAITSLRQILTDSLGESYSDGQPGSTLERIDRGQKTIFRWIRRTHAELVTHGISEPGEDP